jgi:DNA-binding NarL/FixJ family response regulator
LLLEGQPDFQVIGEAAGGLETVSLVKALQPHVLVVDLMMSDLNGLEVTRQVQRSAPATHMVILSIYSDEPHVLEALRCGALREREVSELAARDYPHGIIEPLTVLSPMLHTPYGLRLV